MLTTKKYSQLLAVFNHIQEGIVITDKNNVITDVNNSFEQITKYSKEEVLGRTPNIFQSKLQNKKFYKEMWRDIVNTGSWKGKIYNKNKFGVIYPEQLQIHSIYENNEIVNYIAIFSDLSFIEDQERILIHQSKIASMGEMIENIAHQWRQPLSVITAAATGLKLSFDFKLTLSDEDIKKTLDTINKQSQYLSKTIDNFRNFANDEKSEMINFSVKNTLKKVRLLTENSYSMHFIEYIEDFDNLDIELMQNEKILIQALINIFNNTKDALMKNTDKKYFFVFFKTENDKVVIYLRDNAGGITSENIEKIFDPYFTTKHKSIGTGLGLYMTYKIITEQLLGTICVQNISFEYKGNLHKGTQFKIIL